MDFNIKKYIDKLKERTEALKPQDEQEILKIIHLFNKNITPENITYRKGIISLKNLSPIITTSLKLKSHLIKKEAQKKDIIIRDII